MFRLFRLTEVGGCNALRAKPHFSACRFDPPPPLPIQLILHHLFSVFLTKHGFLTIELPCRASRLRALEKRKPRTKPNAAPISRCCKGCSEIALPSKIRNAAKDIPNVQSTILHCLAYLDAKMRVSSDIQFTSYCSIRAERFSTALRWWSPTTWPYNPSVIVRYCAVAASVQQPELRRLRAGH